MWGECGPASAVGGQRGRFPPARERRREGVGTARVIGAWIAPPGPGPRPEGACGPPFHPSISLRAKRPPRPRMALSRWVSCLRGQGREWGRRRGFLVRGGDGFHGVAEGGFAVFAYYDGGGAISSPKPLASHWRRPPWTASRSSPDYCAVDHGVAPCAFGGLREAGVGEHAGRRRALGGSWRAAPGRRPRTASRSSAEADGGDVRDERRGVEARRARRLAAWRAGPSRAGSPAGHTPRERGNAAGRRRTS